MLVISSETFSPPNAATILSMPDTFPSKNEAL
ncbi:hypothetical protein ABIB68_007997 [Bradyrhizobium sp. F1.2.2]